MLSIENDNLHLSVSPATGRIIHFSRPNESNLLWINPRAAECKSPFAGWLNHGGDKVWLWPEADWKTRTPKNAPPGDPPASPYTAAADANSIRMASPLIADYGLRIVREIKLIASSVIITNRLEQIAAPRKAFPVTPWTVTQLPTGVPIFARLLPVAPAHQGFPESPWRDVQVAGNIATLTRPGTPWMKIGLESDLLATPLQGELFIARTPLELNAPTGYEPLRRAQVFSDPDDSPFRLPGIPPYIELEFTGPLKTLTPGDSVSLTVEWSLVPLPRDIPTFLRAL